MLFFYMNKDIVLNNIYICLPPSNFLCSFTRKRRMGGRSSEPILDMRAIVCVASIYLLWHTTLFAADGRTADKKSDHVSRWYTRLSAAPKSVGDGVKETLCSYLYGVKDIGSINGICCSSRAFSRSNLNSRSATTKRALSNCIMVPPLLMSTRTF